MDPLQLWAGVRFAAQNGNTGGLLTAAAQNGLHLSAITAQPGGFCARCAAWRYPELSRLARRYRVRLRVQKRDGLFFRLRPLLRRRGLWAGLFLFLPLLLWLQGAVWATDFTTLTPGQRARAEVILRQQALSAGEFVSEEKLTAGEYALLQSGEFSWASLNFSKGRLIVEACVAEARGLDIHRLFALTYQLPFFNALGFSVVEKEVLPQKVWVDCVHCPKFPDCDETAVLLEI